MPLSSAAQKSKRRNKCASSGAIATVNLTQSILESCSLILSWKSDRFYMHHICSNVSDFSQPNSWRRGWGLLSRGWGHQVSNKFIIIEDRKWRKLSCKLTPARSSHRFHFGTVQDATNLLHFTPMNFSLGKILVTMEGMPAYWKLIAEVTDAYTFNGWKGGLTLKC